MHKVGQIRVCQFDSEFTSYLFYEYSFLFLRKTRSNDKNWTLVYNGTDTRWVIADLETAVYYEFAVRARNAKGWSEYSPPSKKYSPSPAVNEGKKKPKTISFHKSHMYTCSIIVKEMI